MRSLKTQLLFSHLTLVMLMVVLMAGAVVSFFRLGGSIDRILRANYNSVVAAQDMKETLERQDSAATFFLAGESQKARALYQTNWPLFRNAYQTEAHNITETGEQQIADAIGSEYSVYRQNLERLLYASPPLAPAQANRLYFDTLEPQFAGLKRRAQDVLNLNQAAIVEADGRAKAEARRATLTGVGVTVGAFFAALYFALRMTRASLTPLRSLARQAEEIGAGRWNQRIELRRNDEIGALAHSFNHMAEQLREAWEQEEQRLHRAERMSDAALESLYDPVIVTDAAGKVAHINRAGQGLFGPSERLVGRVIELAVEDKRIAQAVERAIRQERVSASEDEAGLVTLQSGDTPRTYRLRASPMRDDEGRLLGAVTVLEDVTHLRELDRLKTEFIGVASHELRTPVTSLLLSVQLLQEGAVGELSADQKEVIAAQREDLERLERMMRDLLDITRLEAGVTPPRFEIVPPAELVRGAVNAVDTSAQAKGVTLTWDAPLTLPDVRADRSQIHRVLVNLLNNAIRHTPSGGSVNVRAQWKEAGQGLEVKAPPTRSQETRAQEERGSAAGVEFTVHDTGAGIPADYLPHIFERFVQVPGATRGGAGLGLSIVQTIIAAHHAQIRVTSELGKGSAFMFVLPPASA